MTRATEGAAIRVLSERVRNQIAAGEVVERPASVVKELVENALDAGASEITVELEAGGVDLVRVVDDGRGMGPEDLALAFVSHATSKLAEVDDLLHIGTLGFRGEALASIGSVARARLLARRATDEHAWSIEDEGGRIGPVVAAGAPRGTTVEVRDLFFNVPARRAFLKRTATELARCLDVLQRLALAHLGTGFVVKHDRGRVFDVEREMDLVARVRRLFGAELAAALVPVAARDGSVALEGLLAPPRFSRGDTARQMWFLNGRPLRDRVLSRCLVEAYRGFNDEKRQPVAFLSLSVPPEAVDVNVHPTKSEVRFRDERRLFPFLLGALRAAVARTDMATPGSAVLVPFPRLVGRDGPRGATPWSAARPRPEELEVREGPATAPPRAAPLPGVEADAPAAPGPVLQVAATYLVREVEGGLEIVDQHALHERVTYERLKAGLRAGGIEVQRELVPELVELARSEVHALEEHLASLARLGIEIALFGPTTVAVHALPALLPRRAAPRLVRELVAALADGGALPGPEELLEHVVHSMACRRSVMAGDVLAPEEAEALLAAAARLDHDQTCPHGRPTRVRLSLADLERAFHRR
ncbi:MAG TPA: DNA mismatch repair endonuclease MutL [Planctomycetota bacterium]